MFGRVAPANVSPVDPKQLYCCKNAPRGSDAAPGSAWIWPPVENDWWCADGAAKGSSLNFASSVHGLPAGQPGPVGPPGVSDLTFGLAALDFGTTPSGDAEITITGQPGIDTGSNITAWLQDDPQANSLVRLTAMAIVAGVGFTLRGDLNGALATGIVNTRWSYA